jgi:hypothetical protein
MLIAAVILFVCSRFSQLMSFTRRPAFGQRDGVVDLVGWPMQRSPPAPINLPGTLSI